MPRGDNLALHAALNFCQEGDVLVVSNEEDNTRALMGEIMMAYLRYTKKVAGIMLDGPIRDIDEIGHWDFPVYCTGTTPGGPYKEGPGEINVPIACGGVSVNPGDIILADPTASSSSPGRTLLSFWRMPRSSSLPMRRSWPPPRTAPPTVPGFRRPWTKRASRSSTTCTSPEYRNL